MEASDFLAGLHPANNMTFHERKMNAKTLVVGLGNPILSDDGVGVKVAYEVAEALPDRLQDWTTITEACVGGLRLMELMIGYQNAIIIDAFMPLDQKIVPGTIHRFSLEDLRALSPTQHSASAHDTTLVTAIDAGRKLGLVLPEDVIIYAVEVENVLDFSETGTAAVDQVIPEVSRIVLAELEQLEEAPLAVSV